MDSKLTMPFENELTNEEITSIDEYVERTYEEHKNNHKELTRLGMQASAAVAAGKVRAAELANQGFFKNLLGNFTGKNRKLRGEIDREFCNISRSKYKNDWKIGSTGKINFWRNYGSKCKIKFFE